MAGPPADVSPSELWAKLSQPRPSEVIDFPRKDANGNPVGQVRIQVLKMEDHDAARLRAHAALKRKAHYVGLEELSAADMSSSAVETVLGDLAAREILVLACLSDKAAAGTEESDQPFYPQVFKDTTAIGSVLSPDEVAVLFAAYQLVQHKFGPYERTIQSKEDLDAWVARLAGDLEDPLVIVRQSLPHLAEVITSLSVSLFSISRILRSQWESLPPTLASELETYCLGTSYFGKPLSEREETGSERSPDSDEPSAEPEPIGIPVNRTITTEEAARFAEQLKRGG